MASISTFYDAVDTMAMILFGESFQLAFFLSKCRLLSLRSVEIEFLSLYNLFCSEEVPIEEVMISLLLIPPFDCLREKSSLSLTYLVFLS